MTRLEAIAAREAASTKGPWRRPNLNDKNDPMRWYGGVVNHERVILSGNTNFPEAADDEEFCAKARADIPWLLEAVSRLAGALEEIVDILEHLEVLGVIDHFDCLDDGGDGYRASVATAKSALARLEEEDHA